MSAMEPDFFSDPRAGTVLSSESMSLDSKRRAVTRQAFWGPHPLTLCCAGSGTRPPSSAPRAWATFSVSVSVVSSLCGTRHVVSHQPESRTNYPCCLFQVLQFALVSIVVSVIVSAKVVF